MFSTLGSYLDEIVLKPNTKHILCGDLNINFFHKGKKYDQLISTLSAIGLSFVSSQDATGETNYSKTLLDVFFTNFTSSQKVLKTAVSDHYNIKLQFSENTKFSDKKCNKIRVWSKLQNTDNPNQIRAKIVSYSKFLLKKKLNSINCNESLIKFQDFLNKELNKIIPNKRNWIDNEVKNAAIKKHHKTSLKAIVFKRKIFISQSKIRKSIQSS